MEGGTTKQIVPALTYLDKNSSSEILYITYLTASSLEICQIWLSTAIPQTQDHQLN